MPTLKQLADEHMLRTKPLDRGNLNLLTYLVNVDRPMFPGDFTHKFYGKEVGQMSHTEGDYFISPGFRSNFIAAPRAYCITIETYLRLFDRIHSYNDFKRLSDTYFDRIIEGHYDSRGMLIEESQRVKVQGDKVIVGDEEFSVQDTGSLILRVMKK